MTTDATIIEVPISVESQTQTFIEVGVTENSITTCEVEAPVGFVESESTSFVSIDVASPVIAVEVLTQNVDTITVEVGVPGRDGGFLNAFFWTTTQW